jgi:hypothetical protein
LNREGLALLREATARKSPRVFVDGRESVGRAATCERRARRINQRALFGRIAVTSTVRWST